MGPIVLPIKEAHLHNVYWGVGDGPSPQVLQQVSGLQAPKLHICILVVPHHARLPQLYKGPAHVLPVNLLTAFLVYSCSAQPVACFHSHLDPSA